MSLLSEDCIVGAFSTAYTPAGFAKVPLQELSDRGCLPKQQQSFCTRRTSIWR